MGRYGANAAMSGIYKITNNSNGKIYVGQSKNVWHRRDQHFAALHRGYHENKEMQADWNATRGRGFRFDVIEYCGVAQLNEREEYWIHTLNTLEPHGYNKGWVPYKRKEQKKPAYKQKHYYRSR